MALAFRRVTCPPFRDFDAAAPDGVVIGLIGENGSGQGRLLRLAAGLGEPNLGSVEHPRARFLGPDGPLELSPAPLIAIEHTLSYLDAFERECAAVEIDRCRRAGATILLVSHEEELIARLADEVWWLHEGRLAGRGDPREMLDAYRKHIAQRVRAWAQTAVADRTVTPQLRRGDGRAEILRIDTIGENGCPTMVWRSGELAVVKVLVRFRDAVADPVVGMLIRSRIGLNVYGTNTELEHLKLGPCAAGDTLEIAFSFRCELCPQEYALTVASHDPDGLWHDWLEDAVAFSVTDTRYTAGVANLRAHASFTQFRGQAT
jgi:ABC-type sugar transport system ATPase subunit